MQCHILTEILKCKTQLDFDAILTNAFVICFLSDWHVVMDSYKNRSMY